MIGFIIALVSGALMSIQGVFNTEVSKQTGLWTASSFVQFTGLLTCLAVWSFAERDQSFLSLMKVSPKYVLLGGVRVRASPLQLSRASVCSDRQNLPC